MKQNAWIPKEVIFGQQRIVQKEQSVVSHLGRRAFTLIELLVVMAIIGLLIAILIPGLRLAQEAANDVICKTRLDQIFRGVFIFSNEHNDALPNFKSESRPLRVDFWAIEISRVMEVFEPEVFKCPSDAAPRNRIRVQIRNGQLYSPNAPIPDGGPKPHDSFFNISYRGYCDFVERKISSYTAPDQALLLTEIITPGGKTCFYLPDIYYLKDQELKPDDLVVSTALRHLDGSNFLMVDGHVERLDPRQAGELAMNTEFQMNGNVSR